MAAPLEYEVREEYRDYPLDKLLEAPVTCFQGVGDTQSEILSRYFDVKTVKELANMPAFTEALAVQETVLEGGEIANQTVSQASQGRQLNFHIRPTDQQKIVSELSEAPVHVLEGLTPGQDLALYDSFRITNLLHLAHNRIMLEARVIDYLSGQGGGPSGTAQGDAVSSILGSRTAAAYSGAERAKSGDFGEDSRILTVTNHVRDRVEAMRQRSTGQPDTTGMGVGVTTQARMETIRQGREGGASTSRGEELDRVGKGAATKGRDQIIAERAGGRSRTGDILANRGLSGVSGDAASSVTAGRTGSRTDSILAAREGGGGGGAGPSTMGGAMVHPQKDAAEAAADTATAAAIATAEKEKELKDVTLPTEEEIERSKQQRRPPARQINWGPVMAAAAVALLVLAGLIWFIVSLVGPDEGAMEDGTVATATTESAAGEGAAPSGATGAQTGVAGQAGTAATTTGTETPRVQGTHSVVRGDTLWRISIREYSDPLNWPSIFMENQGQIENPDLIYPAQEFRIPSNPEYRFPAYPSGYVRSR